MAEAEASDDKNQAQLVYAIDPQLDLKAEGYLMDINTNQIQITAKDQAGLIYGLATLEQLMEDAEEQEVHLPYAKSKTILYSPTAPSIGMSNTIWKPWITIIG